MKNFSLYLLICLLSTITLAEAQTNMDDGSTPMQNGRKMGRPDVPGTLTFDIGWNALQDIPDEMAITGFGSRTINIYYYRELSIGKGKFVFMPGFGFGMDRYKFDNDITLVQNDGVVTTENLPADASIKKSMLITNYLDMPLELRFYASPEKKKSSFNIGIGGKVGVRINAQTKVKYELEDEKINNKSRQDYGLNPIRYGITGRVGIGGVNFFYYHSLSELFDGDNGPIGTASTTNTTFGISFTGF